MFGKKRTEQVDTHVWNGWTMRLIEKLNGKDHLTIVLNGLRVTSSFDGEEYAAGARWAATDVESYENMPLLFDERPDGQARFPYTRQEVVLTGKANSLGVSAQAQVFREPWKQVAQHKRAGRLSLNAVDSILGETQRDRQFMTPRLDLSIYDPDGSVLEALRRAFVAARQQGTQPALRSIMREKIAVAAENFGETALNHPFDIARVVVWETWGHVDD